MTAKNRRRIVDVEYVELIGQKMLWVQHKNGTTIFHLTNDEGTLEVKIK